MKFKKICLSVGAATTVVAPVVAVVSCSLIDNDAIKNVKVATKEAEVAMENAKAAKDALTATNSQGTNHQALVAASKNADAKLKVATENLRLALIEAAKASRSILTDAAKEIKDAITSATQTAHEIVDGTKDSLIKAIDEAKKAVDNAKTEQHN